MFTDPILRLFPSLAPVVNLQTPLSLSRGDDLGVVIADLYLPDEPSRNIEFARDDCRPLTAVPRAARRDVLAEMKRTTSEVNC